MKFAHSLAFTWSIIISASLFGGYFTAQLHPLDLLLEEKLLTHYQGEFLVGSILSAFVILTAYGCWSIPKLRREVKKRKKAQSAALELAKHDALTGLPNRRKLHEAFQQLARNTIEGNYRAVMMLDIDGFKPINDVYGHAFGDSVLVALAERLTSMLEEDGFVARLGGDEFAIVTAEYEHKDEIASFARRLLTLFQTPFDIDGKSVSVGCGIGIAIFPDDGYSATELLRRGDIALYRAKSSGRSAYRFFEVNMDASILHRTLLEQRLRAALRSNDIRVHYQPILNLQNERIVGFEALARWHDADFGQVAPAQFIPLAEDCGLITDLTYSVLREATTIAATWPEHLSLSVNISANLLADSTLPLKVVKILGETSFSPERLVLEITETALIKNPIFAGQTLRQLADAKIRIALDDFGTGHSSLSYIRDFPIHTVKIDKSFTMKMSENPECRAIVDAVLVLAKGLGFHTVAEGIEQQDVLEKLNALGCPLGQGFLFGAATSAEAVETLIKQHADQAPITEMAPQSETKQIVG